MPGFSFLYALWRAAGVRPTLKILPPFVTTSLRCLLSALLAITLPGNTPLSRRICIRHFSYAISFHRANITAPPPAADIYYAFADYIF